MPVAVCVSGVQLLYVPFIVCKDTLCPARHACITTIITTRNMHC